MADEHGIIDPLFGYIKLDGGVYSYYTDKANVAQMYAKGPDDYITRESGLSEDVYMANQTIVALGNPKQYLTDRAADLKAIGTTITRIFKEEYLRLLGMGYPSEEAKKHATQHAKEEKKKQEELLDFKYPASLVKRAESGLMDKGHIA